MELAESKILIFRTLEPFGFYLMRVYVYVIVNAYVRDTKADHAVGMICKHQSVKTENVTRVCMRLKTSAMLIGKLVLSSGLAEAILEIQLTLK